MMGNSGYTHSHTLPYNTLINWRADPAREQAGLLKLLLPRVGCNTWKGDLGAADTRDAEMYADTSPLIPFTFTFRCQVPPTSMGDGASVALI